MQSAQQNQPGFISVFIAEDHGPVRERIVAMFDGAAEFAVVGEAETPDAAVEGILRTLPHAVVLDIHLIGGTGLEVLKRVHPLQPGIHFVVLTNHPNVQYRRAFMAAGADCVLDKSTDFLKLPETLQAAVSGPDLPCRRSAY
jgi:DNA-binding NarL/FixJ family response regulator